jgi:hypothetical protein
LPDAALPVRHAGGLILGHIDDSAAWLLSSHAPRARLVRIDGRRLLLDAEADAVPWPDAAQGLRFRMGTNLLEGLEVAGARPALVAVDAASRAAVVEDGALLVDSAPTGTRVGGAVATLWPGMLIASAADPPSSEDSLLVLSRVGGAWRVAPGIRVGGAVRALAAHADGAATGRVAVAVAAAGRFELLHFEARRRP